MTYCALNRPKIQMLIGKCHLVLEAVILPWTLKAAVVCFPGVFFGVHRHTATFFQ